MIRDADVLKLHPDDDIYDIYRSIYPAKLADWEGDCLEFNFYDSGLRKRYNFGLAEMNGSLSLGAIFEKAARIGK